VVLILMAAALPGLAVGAEILRTIDTAYLKLAVGDSAVDRHPSPPVRGPVSLYQLNPSDSSSRAVRNNRHENSPSAPSGR
jgi:hypothetical protein